MRVPFSRKNRPLALAFALGAAAAAGCGPAPLAEQAVDKVEQAAIVDDNGLSMINGLSMTNGLAMTNGLSMTNGLAMTNGLQSGVGMMTSSTGRQTLTYLVRCALPAGRSITKTDQNGASYTFHGKMGLAPQWEFGACDGGCQEWLSACMLAHVNTTGQSIPIYMVAQDTVIRGGRDSAYPNFEGAFFGNIFASPPRAQYCRGRDADVNVVPGRLGDSNRNGEPYQNPWGQQGNCATHCAAANTTDWTFNNCNGFSRVITTWRQAFAGSYGSVTPPAYDFEGSTQKWVVRPGGTGWPEAPGATTTTTSMKYKGNSSLAATIDGDAKGYYIGITSPGVSLAGKTVVMSVWYPQDLPLDFIEPFVQEDGSKNWRYTHNWQWRDWVKPGQWNTISVKVPNDGGNVFQMGVAVGTTARYKGQVYVDMVTY